MERQTAFERLAYGDSVRARLPAMTAREIAGADGVSTEFAAKAVWLARVYTKDERAALGADALARLRPSHLEVVATVAPEARTRLLRRAALESLPVRDLRRLASQTQSPTATPTIGAATDLASARRALEVYAAWDEPSLARLIAGPNGTEIRALAEAGEALAARLEGRSRPTCA